MTELNQCQENSDNLSSILTLLQPANPEDKGSYFLLDCPGCGKHEAFIYKDAIKKSGIYARIKCNRENHCGYSKSISEQFNVSSCAPNQAQVIVHEEAVNYWRRHGLNPWAFVQMGICESPVRLLLRPLVGAQDEKHAHQLFKDLFFEKDKEKWRWRPWKSGFVNSQTVRQNFYPVLHANEDPLHIFEGEWDWFKSIEDGLASTAGLWGAATRPKCESDWAIFVPFKTICLVPQRDAAGNKGFSELALLIREKFPDKQVSIITLPFEKGELDQGAKDYCDYRLKHDRSEFLALPPMPVEPRKTKKELKEEKEQQRRQQAIESTASSCYIGDDGRVIPGEAADYFVSLYKDNILYCRESFWFYEGGVWARKDEKAVGSLIKEMLGKKLATKSMVDNILYLVVRQVFTEKKDLFDTNQRLLNFPNGMLDIYEDKLIPHDRNYFSTIQFAFDCPLAEIKAGLAKPANGVEILQKLCPTWLKFGESLGFAEETIKRLIEWGGYCLTRETRIEKCLFLKGEGENGKSTFLEGLLSVLKGMASNLELTQLFDKFKLAEIEGKLVNIGTDMDTNHVIDPMFKKLVSGETVEVERKYQMPFRFNPFCKFLFSANDFLPTKDRSRGFFRRFDVLEFKKIFTEKERDENIKDVIRSGAEAKGIFVWMYWGLKRLIVQKWKMTPSPEFDAAKQEFEIAANPLKQFVQECCTIDTTTVEEDKKSFIDTKSFRDRYVTWCQQKGYEALAENKLGREMKRLGIDHGRKRDNQGNRFYAYFGLGWM